MNGRDLHEGMRVLVGPVTSVRRYGIVSRVERDHTGAGASALVVFDEDWFDASELEPG
jgi:hypothetical protein